MKRNKLSYAVPAPSVPRMSQRAPAATTEDGGSSKRTRSSVFSLYPVSLVDEALDSLLVSQGRLGIRLLDETRREEAVHGLADAFDVNPAVARIRVEELFPASASGQLTL